MSTNFDGRLERLEHRLQALPGGAMSPAEEQAEREQAAALADWHARYDHVTARHVRRAFLRAMHAIPEHWPCAEVHADPLMDWESLAPEDTGAVRFWTSMQGHLAFHCRLAEKLGKRPHELPLWENSHTWQELIDAAGEELAEAMAALKAEDAEGAEALRRDISERFGVRLEAMPPAQHMLSWSRYPQSKNELARLIRGWREREAPPAP